MSPGGEDNGFEEQPIHDVDELASHDDADGIPIWPILLLTGIILLVIFIAQNSEQADVELLWLQGRFALSIVILASAVIGAIIALLSVVIIRRRRRRAREAADPKR